MDRVGECDSGLDEVDGGVFQGLTAKMDVAFQKSVVGVKEEKDISAGGRGPFIPGTSGAR
jgi:hypothetical protein